MRRAALGLAAVLVGCATLFNPYQPGAGVTLSVVSRWGCDVVEVERMTEEYKVGLGTGRNWIPRVGWDACRVLAAVGAPTSVDLQESALGRSASWWYQETTDAHLLSLDQDGNRWIVTYVGW